MSYRPMFRFNETETQGNALRFATYEEAYDNAAALFARWTRPSDFFVEENEDPVNYAWVDRALVAVKPAD